MDSYFSVICLGLFVPVTVIVYQIAPRRARPFVLLAASYLFFWSLSGALLAFLLLSTVSVWAVGLALGALLDVRDRELAAPGADRRAGDAQALYGGGGRLPVDHRQALLRRRQPVGQAV